MLTIRVISEPPKAISGEYVSQPGLLSLKVPCLGVTVAVCPFLFSGSRYYHLGIGVILDLDRRFVINTLALPPIPIFIVDCLSVLAIRKYIRSAVIFSAVVILSVNFVGIELTGIDGAGAFLGTVGIGLVRLPAGHWRRRSP